MKPEQEKASLKKQDKSKAVANNIATENASASLTPPAFQLQKTTEGKEKKGEQTDGINTPFQLKLGDADEDGKTPSVESVGSAYQLKESGDESKGKLPGQVRGKMENTLGSDFSKVKINTNSQKATDMGAHAFTQGNDVSFAPGQYKPETSQGQELIGHELTHVVQQRQGRVQPTTQAKGVAVNDDSSLEGEADRMGKKAAMAPAFEEKHRISGPSLQKKSIYGSSKNVVQHKMGDGNDLKSKRFSGDTTLEAVYDGERTLSFGSFGSGVKKVQKALNDGGYSPSVFGATGLYGWSTRNTVKNFQKALGFKDKAVTGVVNKSTMVALDKRFVKEGKAQPITIPSTTGPTEVIKDIVGGLTLVGKVAGTKGYKALNAKEKDKFMKYVGGIDPFISKPARADFEPKFNAGTFDKTKAKSYRDYLKKQPGRLPLISSGPNPRKDKRKPYKISSPSEKKKHPFHSGKATAKRYSVRVDKTSVRVYLPKKQIPANGNYHTIDQIAKGLALLHPTSLGVVKRVDMCPGANPQDKHWEKEYKIPGFRSYMTAGAAGIISIYPTSGAPTQGELDSSLMHETGHTLSHQRFGKHNSSAWKNWNRHAKTDVIYPSDYATKSQDEDAAESMALYTQVRGNVYEAFVRQIMPNRFRVLDTMVSQDEK